MVNKVILIGNVGADPEIKHLEGDRVVANFKLATSERFKKNNEVVEQTEWHNIVIWGKLAEIVEKYVTKGMRLYLEGKIVTRSWEDQSGVKKYATDISVNTMQMLSFKKDGENSSSNQGAQSQCDHGGGHSDDLPF